MFSIRKFLASFAVSVLRQLKTPTLLLWPPISSLKRCFLCVKRASELLKIAPRIHQKSPFEMQNLGRGGTAFSPGPTIPSVPSAPRFAPPNQNFWIRPCKCVNATMAETYLVDVEAHQLFYKLELRRTDIQYDFSIFCKFL